MAYCRWGDASEVYMIGVDDGIYCCSCSLEGPHLFAKRTEAINHLLLHRQSGYKVPDNALDELRAEIDIYGDDYSVED